MSSQCASYRLASSDNTNYFGVPLPIDLSVAGLPGCQLLHTAEIFSGFLTPHPTQPLAAVWTVSMPNLPLLLGQDFFFQGLHLELSSWPHFAAMTNGVAVRIGDQ